MYCSVCACCRSRRHVSSTPRAPSPPQMAVIAGPAEALSRVACLPRCCIAQASTRELSPWAPYHDSVGALTIALLNLPEHSFERVQVAKVEQAPAPPRLLLPLCCISQAPLGARHSPTLRCALFFALCALFIGGLNVGIRESLVPLEKAGMSCFTQPGITS